MSINGTWKIMVDPYRMGYYDFHGKPQKDGGVGANRAPKSKSDHEELGIPDTESSPEPSKSGVACRAASAPGVVDRERRPRDPLLLGDGHVHGTFPAAGAAGRVAAALSGPGRRTRDRGSARERPESGDSLEEAVSGRAGSGGAAGLESTGGRGDESVAEPAYRRPATAAREAADANQHYEVQGGLAAIAVGTAGSGHDRGCAGGPDGAGQLRPGAVFPRP